MSKYLLLQTASPDAVVRLVKTVLANEKKEIKRIYFQQQHHESLEDFLNHHVHGSHGQDGLLMQVNAILVIINVVRLVFVYLLYFAWSDQRNFQCCISHTALLCCLNCAV